MDQETYGLVGEMYPMHMIGWASMINPTGQLGTDLDVMGLWLVGCVGCYVSFLMMKLMISPLGFGLGDLWIGSLIKRETCAYPLTYVPRGPWIGRVN